MEHPSHPVESHWRTSLRNRIIQASSLLEVLLSGLVLIGLLLSVVPLIRWMPGLLFDGNEAEIRTFLERSLDIVIGIEFIKMLAKHSPGSSLEVLLYAIARHLVVGHDSAVENLLSVGAIALIFRPLVRICRTATPRRTLPPPRAAFPPTGSGDGIPKQRLRKRPRQKNNHTQKNHPAVAGKRLLRGGLCFCVIYPVFCRDGQSGTPYPRGCAGCWSGACK